MGSFCTFAKKQTTVLKTSLIVLGFLFGLFISAKAANASTLYLSPAAGTYSVGASFSVSINVSSPEKAINAIQANINYPTDKMVVTSLSKNNSIMSLWVQEPSFSGGSVSLAGVVLNPGFTGSGGRVLTINFRVISTGTAKLTIEDGSVLANDGNGTETITSTSGAQFSFVPAVEQPKPTQAAPTPVPVVTPTPKPVVVAEIEAPTIQKYTDTVSPTDQIWVQGMTQPNFTARLYIENPGNRIKVGETKADSNGQFTVTWDQKLAGSQSQATQYYMRVDATDGTRTSKMTNVLPVSVVQKGSNAIMLMVSLAISILVIIILIIALLIALSRRRDEPENNIHEEVKKAENLVHSTFDNLRKNLDYYTDVVESTSENRQLSKAEEIIVKRMERNLDEAEKTIEGGVENIDDKAKGK